jgi:hypothetical protein
VGPRAVLDAVVKRKIPSSRRESNPRTPIVQPVAQRYTDIIIKGNGKVVPMLLLLTEHHAIKAYWWSGGIAQLIL